MSRVDFHSGLIRASIFGRDIEKINRVARVMRGRNDGKEKKKEKKTARQAEGEGVKRGLRRREEKEETKKNIHLARGQEGHACLEIEMRWRRRVSSQSRGTRLPPPTAAFCRVSSGLRLFKLPLLLLPPPLLVPPSPFAVAWCL